MFFNKKADFGAYDLVVLDEDPLLRPERIEERTVDMTFVGGERVYEHEGAV